MIALPVLQPTVQEREAPQLPTVTVSQHGKRIQELIEQVERLPDLAQRTLMLDTLQSLLTFYGQGLERILRIIKNADASGQKAMDAIAKDKLISSILLIHDLHPDSLEKRLHDALAKVQPYLKTHGGNVEVAGLENGVARLRLQGTCKSCASSAVTMELAIRRSIEENCPDLEGLEVEGMAQSQSPKATGKWVSLPSYAEPGEGEMKFTHINGVSVAVCRLAGNLFAYRNHCPVCELTFDPGKFEDGALRCPNGHSFDVRQAGIGIKEPSTHLDPFPLLVETGQVSVCVG